MGYLERVSGIEPPSHPWQGRILTVVLYPQVRNIIKKLAFSLFPSAAVIPEYTREMIGYNLIYPKLFSFTFYRKKDPVSRRGSNIQ